MGKANLITVGLNPTIDRILEVPGFAVGQHAKAHLRWRQPSGKAFNVSRALAALGIPNTAAGFVGADALASFEAAARSSGITPSFTPLDGRTRENTTIIDPANHTETHLREEGPRVTPADLDRLFAALRDLLRPDAIVILTGSLPPGAGPEDFGRVLDECASQGARLVVDTSGPALRIAADRTLWLAKPNRQELAELIGREAQGEPELIQQARRLLRNAGAVLLSAGEDGAYLVASAGAWHAHVQLPTDAIRSTVGCGDALLAGFLAAVVQSKRLDEAAVRQAVAVATASAMNELPAAFSPDDVRSLLPGVQVEALGAASSRTAP